MGARSADDALLGVHKVWTGSSQPRPLSLGTDRGSSDEDDGNASPCLRACECAAGCTYLMETVGSLPYPWVDEQRAEERLDTLATTANGVCRQGWTSSRRPTRVEAGERGRC
jgi:hypothetical protein